MHINSALAGVPEADRCAGWQTGRCQPAEEGNSDARLGKLGILTLGTEDAPASALDMLGKLDSPQPMEKSRRDMARDAAPPMDTLKKTVSGVMAARAIEVIENEFVRHARNSIASISNGSGRVSPGSADRSPSFARPSITGGALSPRAARPAL